jgi:hypothetical protein
MTTIFERVTTALNTISPAVPFALAPYKGTLPGTFMAYQMIAGAPEQSADGSETERSYTVQISIYKTAGLISLPDTDSAMIAAGFQKGNERQLPQDPETGHFGIAKEYHYLETKE